MYKLFSLVFIVFLVSCGNYHNTRIDYDKVNKIVDISGYKISNIIILNTKTKGSGSKIIKIHGISSSGVCSRLTQRNYEGDWKFKESIGDLLSKKDACSVEMFGNVDFITCKKIPSNNYFIISSDGAIANYSNTSITSTAYKKCFNDIKLHIKSKE
jgi:hypothetical protein